LSKMGSALLNPAAALEFAETEETGTLASGVREEHAAAVPGTAAELRVQVAERLAAHRIRRGGAKASADVAAAVLPEGTRAARIAAAVAERYAQTPSYRAVLAAEAERATQQARAAAEVAALNAQVIAAAQQRLLAAYDEHATRAVEPEMAAVAMNLWPEAEEEKQILRRRRIQSRPEDLSGSAVGSAAESPVAGGGLTVRLYDDAARAMRADLAMASDTLHRASMRPNRTASENAAAEAMALDDEIAFRHAPVFEDPPGPPLALPANLIEFPRQLVAARKARPRYAEGPLRDEAEGAPGDGQLRIFEVDPAQISTTPDEAAPDSRQWTSIWLDAPTEAAGAMENAAGDEPADESFAREAVALDPASLARRGMAAAINFAIVGSGVAAFAVVVAATLGRGVSWPAGLSAIASLRYVAGAIAAQTDLQAKSAGLVIAVSGAFLLLVYHALFHSFATATPGMRCVRIAFCTFEDGNPTRRAVRRRMLAALLSAFPLGMGYAWAALDEEKLTWHDRISKMYLRQY
jgi:hypothetical protein